MSSLKTVHHQSLGRRGGRGLVALMVGISFGWPAAALEPSPDPPGRRPPPRAERTFLLSGQWSAGFRQLKARIDNRSSKHPIKHLIVVEAQGPTPREGDYYNNQGELKKSAGGQTILAALMGKLIPQRLGCDATLVGWQWPAEYYQHSSAERELLVGAGGKCQIRRFAPPPGAPAIFDKEDNHRHLEHFAARVDAYVTKELKLSPDDVLVIDNYDVLAGLELARKGYKVAHQQHSGAAGKARHFKGNWQALLHELNMDARLMGERLEVGLLGKVGAGVVENNAQEGLKQWLHHAYRKAFDRGSLHGISPPVKAEWFRPDMIPNAAAHLEASLAEAGSQLRDPERAAIFCNHRLEERKNTVTLIRALKELQTMKDAAGANIDPNLIMITGTRLGNPQDLAQKVKQYESVRDQYQLAKKRRDGSASAERLLDQLRDLGANPETLELPAERAHLHEIVKLADELGVLHRLAFVQADRHRMITLMNHYKETNTGVFVLPSTYEPHGMAVADAQALRMQIAAGKEGGPSVITRYRTSDGEEAHAAALFDATDPVSMARGIADRFDLIRNPARKAELQAVQKAQKRNSSDLTESAYAANWASYLRTVDAAWTRLGTTAKERADAVERILNQLDPAIGTDEGPRDYHEYLEWVRNGHWAEPGHPAAVPPEKRKAVIAKVMGWTEEEATATPTRGLHEVTRRLATALSRVKNRRRTSEAVDPDLARRLARDPRAQNVGMSEATERVRAFEAQKRRILADIDANLRIALALVETRGAKWGSQRQDEQRARINSVSKAQRREYAQVMDAVIARARRQADLASSNMLVKWQVPIDHEQKVWVYAERGRPISIGWHPIKGFPLTYGGHHYPALKAFAEGRLDMVISVPTGADGPKGLIDTIKYRYDLVDHSLAGLGTGGEHGILHVSKMAQYPENHYRVGEQLFQAFCDLLGDLPSKRAYVMGEDHDAWLRQGKKAAGEPPQVYDTWAYISEVKRQVGRSHNLQQKGITIGVAPIARKGEPPIEGWRQAKPTGLGEIDRNPLAGWPTATASSKARPVGQVLADALDPNSGQFDLAEFLGTPYQAWAFIKAAHPPRGAPPEYPQNSPFGGIMALPELQH
jgi:glycosyltransferase involved in cell wall biosynthesis